jgi:hypothetical protein
MQCLIIEGSRPSIFVYDQAKNISVFLKERFVSCEFLTARATHGNFFYESRFDGNINFDSGGNVSHVAFFERIRGRDNIVELVYMPRWNEILCFNCIYGSLNRRVKGFL